MNTDNDTYTAGSCFDDFLLEEGLLYEAQTVAMKKVLAFQIEKAMQEQNLSKTEEAVTILLTVFYKNLKINSLQFFSVVGWNSAAYSTEDTTVIKMNCLA